MKRSVALLFVSALALSACNSKSGTNATQQTPGNGVGIDLASMDKAVVPGDDFYHYANGSWLKKTQIPQDRSSIGAFWIADQQREKNTRELFDGIIKSNPTSGNDALIANYYKAYLDTAAIDRAGLAPAKADLDSIN